MQISKLSHIGGIRVDGTPRSATHGCESAGIRASQK